MEIYVSCGSGFPNQTEKYVFSLDFSEEYPSRIFLMGIMSCLRIFSLFYFAVE